MRNEPGVKGDEGDAEAAGEPGIVLGRSLQILAPVPAHADAAGRLDGLERGVVFADGAHHARDDGDARRVRKVLRVSISPQPGTFVRIGSRASWMWEMPSVRSLATRWCRRRRTDHVQTPTRFGRMIEAGAFTEVLRGC